MPGILNSLLGRSGAAAVTYATWNPSALGSGTSLSGGNRTSASTGNTSDLATGGKASGKWYAEITKDSGSTVLIGVGNASAGRASFPGQDANGWAVYSSNGNKYNSGSGSAYGTSYTNGDVIMVALDMDNGKVWMGKAGTGWFNSGNPAAGTNAAFTGLTGTLYILGGGDGGARQMTGNWGQAAFTATPPSGFSAWTV
jgi:hypothetical protein